MVTHGEETATWGGDKSIWEQQTGTQGSRTQEYEEEIGVYENSKQGYVEQETMECGSGKQKHGATGGQDTESRRQEHG